MSKIFSPNGVDGFFCTEIDDGKLDSIVQDFYCSYCGNKMVERRAEEKKYNNANGEKVTKITIILYCPENQKAVSEFDRHDSYSFSV